MRREAAVITSAHLDRRLPITPGDDEIPRLARTLNEMLDRIDASQRLQRQFVSDASHELRSPLATLRQLAEVAEGYPGRVETADLAADVLAEEQRMEDLVNALLVLARLDDAPAPATTGRSTWTTWCSMEARRQRDGGARIDVSGVSAGQVAGHPVLLGQAVRNLLANAVRHARDRVTVTLDEHDDRVLLVVDDNGPGIPEEERTRVFERFVRLDESRARDDGGGAGLGLAIVRKVVESSGGTVVVGDAPGGGARMTVSLPAVASGS